MSVLNPYSDPIYQNSWRDMRQLLYLIIPRQAKAFFIRCFNADPKEVIKMHYDNWAVVWSDNEEIDKILGASESQIRKWYDKIAAGEATFKLPLIEYSTGHGDSKPPLDFERETTLINSLEPLNGRKFLEKLHSRKPFKPFVAMIEGTFLVVFDLPKYYRSKWRNFKDSHLLGEDSLRKIESLLQLKDWEIIEQFTKRDHLREGKTIQTFDIDIMREAEKRYPAALQMINAQIFKEKPVLTVNYNGNKYLSITFERAGQPPHILFPETAREYIPNSASFYGRVCGIANFVANPPLEGMDHIILQSIILALPLTY